MAASCSSSSLRLAFLFGFYAGIFSSSSSSSSSMSWARFLVFSLDSFWGTRFSMKSAAVSSWVAPRTTRWLPLARSRFYRQQIS